jgi:glucose-6-phosphate 1-dehydrogenase
MTNGTELPPVEMVIFGAAGDLTWRKLIPMAATLISQPAQMRRIK